MISTKYNQGFTLFEVLLYVAIFGIVMYFIGGFAYNIYSNKERISALQEVNENGRFMIESVTGEVEKATRVLPLN